MSGATQYADMTQTQNELPVDMVADMVADMVPQRVPFVQHFFKHKNCHLTLCSCNLITDYYPFFRKPTCVSLPVHRPLHSWATFLLFSSSCSGMPFIPVVCSQSSFVAHFGMSLAHLQDVCWTFSQLLADFFFVLKWFSSFYIVLLNLKQLSSLFHILFLEEESHISCYLFV